ncbi:ABC transporter, permease protein, putative [Emticicia oligotrophica DSM 17448]|uniref:ABC transporter, permease protein, putative n=1 Tax=Emticicia oligotrophica (strain DSM 17448 / CIP 109782 / MTCC 6937 / GPTSA100-15) TaxID=929562 RepID=A0ABM5N4C1_EMTOG|nr:ABC transporter permease [Emticicia oligotrophica]AFK04354.1 ABC transporter, permease protein, putative [Emticicia oligotrophica DSM 17448]
MKNILLVLRREYLVRIKKKSFWIMTLLMPLLISGFYALLFWGVFNSRELQKVMILDESDVFTQKFKDSEKVKFQFSKLPLDSAMAQLNQKKIDIVALIPTNIIEDPKSLKIFTGKGVGFELQSKIENTIQNEIRNVKLARAGIDQKVLEDADVNVSSKVVVVSKEGEQKEQNTLASTVLGFVTVILMFSTVLGFGMQVMRGVIEEKTNRIIEVIISSVKPFQLMLGKILGVGLVGLTQFALWITLTFALTTISSSLLPSQQIAKAAQEQMADMPQKEKDKVAKKMEQTPTDANKVMKFLESAKGLNIPLIIGCFLFYFLFGYLFYASVYGAIGSAVDNETDTQQFMFPVMLPLLAGYMIGLMTAGQADNKLLFWASIIPFTSPITMMARLPFGVEPWELILSMTLLVAGTLGMVWLAAKIYRVGILMYGKKATFKEIGKWIFYKG